MILFVNVLNVFSVGKTITRKVVLTESTSDAESRISENLAFTPIWNWKFTYIPKWSKYFDSFKIPDTPELPYTEIEADPEEILKQTYSKKNFYKRLLRNPKWLLVYAWYTFDKITEWKIWGDIFAPPEVNPFYKL